MPTVGYTAQVSPPQSTALPPATWLSNGGPGRPPTNDCWEVRTSATAPAVALLPTNTRCTSGVPLYLHGFWFPVLHALPPHEWFVLVSVQLRETDMSVAPGLTVIPPAGVE